MKKEDAIKVKELLFDIEVLNEIKKVMEEEANHWWSFLSPGVRRWHDDGIRMPDILRDEFKKVVEECIDRLNDQIDSI